MGDIADMINDSMFVDDRLSPPASVSCKYCKEAPLWWSPSWSDGKGPWRLVDSKGEIHSCKEYYEWR